MSFLRKVQNDGLIIQLKELLEDFPEINHYNMDRTSFPTIKVNKHLIKCSGCQKTSTEITTSGHAKTCKWSVARNKFDSVFKKLTRYEKENIEYIIQELNF